MPTKDAATLTQEIEERIHALSREFLDLELEQMRKGEIEARQKIDRAKKSITARREELEGKLAEARAAAPSAWSELREGVENAWEELRTAMERAREDFREGPEN